MIKTWTAQIVANETSPSAANENSTKSKQIVGFIVCCTRRVKFSLFSYSIAAMRFARTSEKRSKSHQCTLTAWSESSKHDRWNTPVLTIITFPFTLSRTSIKNTYEMCVCFGVYETGSMTTITSHLSVVTVRREIADSRPANNFSFDSVVGCIVCLSHRRASTAKAWMRKESRMTRGRQTNAIFREFSDWCAVLRWSHQMGFGHFYGRFSFRLVWRPKQTGHFAKRNIHENKYF